MSTRFLALSFTVLMAVLYAAAVFVAADFFAMPYKNKGFNCE